MKRHLYLLSAWCPLTGPVRDMVWAADVAEARRRFFDSHGLEATDVEVERW